MFATFSDKVFQGIERLTKLFAWLLVVLIAVIILQVILRYVFNSGRIYLEELQWHLYAIVIMIGMVYDQSINHHVRVDILHSKFSPRAKIIIEILSILFLILPFALSIFINSLPFVADSWRVNERSASPNGLPWRWLIKSFIPITFFLLILTALACLIKEFRNLTALKHPPTPPKKPS